MDIVKKKIAEKISGKWDKKILVVEKKKILKKYIQILREKKRQCEKYLERQWGGKWIFRKKKWIVEKQYLVKNNIKLVKKYIDTGKNRQWETQ